MLSESSFNFICSDPLLAMVSSRSKDPLPINTFFENVPNFIVVSDCLSSDHFVGAILLYES